jgi:TPR repeat protein
LEPEHLVPPDAVVLRRDRRRWPMMGLIAGILSTPIAYYFVIGGWAPPATNGPQMASVDPIAVAPLAPSKDDGVGSLARSDTSSQVTKPSRTARSPEAGEVAMLQRNETGIQEAPSKKSIRALDADEIKLLMKQGEQFAEVGDLATARVLFQRAAEAGDATAATALGATYDPAVLAKLGVVGINADLEKARFWYQKAASLGSSDAKRRLDLLANR